MVKVSDLVTVDLSTAIQDSNSPFKACQEFIPFFEKYGAKYSRAFSLQLHYIFLC